MVTIATNMAGRGTDILLGGNPEFVAKQEVLKKGVAQPATEGPPPEGFERFYYQGEEYQVPIAEWTETLKQHKKFTDAEHDEVVRLGGLHILGTERHEARRIDNQLRGRAGRQGDPGSSRFYLALEDDLMRIFAKEWVSRLLERLGMEEGVPIESGLISRRIEAAQKAVEGQNFESRKHLLEYDDVMNKQRVAVYGLRKQLLEGGDHKELILEDYVADLLGDLLHEFVPEDKHADEWDFDGLRGALKTRFGLDEDGLVLEHKNRTEMGDSIFDRLKVRYDEKEKLLGPDAMRYHERMLMLSLIDQLWKEHLLNMDHLKEGIGLRGYGQKDPLVEYKRESFAMFEDMMARFQEDTTRYLFNLQIVSKQQAEAEEGAEREVQLGGNGARPPKTSLDSLEKEFRRKKERELQEARMAGSGDMQAVQQVRRSAEKVGRNDPCPCGSGKKYKKCHGTAA